DVDASAAFYMSALGLKEIPNRVGSQKIRWFDLDGIRSIHLIPGDTVAERPRPFSTHVALATTEFDALVDRLKSLGVEYVDITRVGCHVLVEGRVLGRNAEIGVHVLAAGEVDPRAHGQGELTDLFHVVGRDHADEAVVAIDAVPYFAAQAHRVGEDPVFAEDA